MWFCTPNVQKPGNVPVSEQNHLVHAPYNSKPAIQEQKEAKKTCARSRSRGRKYIMYIYNIQIGTYNTMLQTHRQRRFFLIAEGFCQSANTYKAFFTRIHSLASYRAWKQTRAPSTGTPLYRVHVHASAQKVAVSVGFANRKYIVGGRIFPSVHCWLFYSPWKIMCEGKTENRTEYVQKGGSTEKLQISPGWVWLDLGISCRDRGRLCKSQAKKGTNRNIC